MPEQQAQQGKQKQYIAPFEIEFATENSSNVIFPTLARKCRGRWSRNKLGNRTESARRQLTQMPDIPGERIKFSPKDGKATLFDPLEKQPNLVKEIEELLASGEGGQRRSFVVKPRVELQLDDDTYKTLLMDMRRDLDSEHPSIVVISGEFPTEDQIDTLPGLELANPCIPGAIPRYKKDIGRYGRLLQEMEAKGVHI